MGKRGAGGSRPGSGKKAPKDFKKLKRKVGRRAPLKPNETKTGFKFRRVNVAAQSILEEKGDKVTKRKLNLDDLMIKMKHYSSSVRKTGYLGIDELYESHTDVIMTELPKVLAALFEGLTDSGKQAREACVDTLSAIIGDIDSNLFTPLAPLCAAHLRAALTHINTGVRTDGVEALKAIAESLPLGSLAFSALPLLSALLPLLSPSSPAATLQAG
eukprot:CAMPEP_0184494546 /NCGR_PEP_ID=MMETSP0113_2-20130426/28999_1 /TAXON_ID=91329 /ORGANISM="Norrisiella sphaerica, Strain BC52" /LENGTH=214 /DNA_ID=CAMNT_0026880347 /DNA_START=25 /DNA_END=665 /DNA_ORIENTATION=+